MADFSSWEEKNAQNCSLVQERWSYFNGLFVVPIWEKQKYGFVCLPTNYIRKLLQRKTKGKVSRIQ